jgi:hypothetical protein
VGNWIPAPQNLKRNNLCHFLSVRVNSPQLAA